MFFFSTLCKHLSPIDIRIIRDSEILHLLTDSRTLSVPSSTMFFALRTVSGDGHRYIRDLYDRGVRYFVVSDFSEESFLDMPEANWVIVSDTLAALQQLVAWKRSLFDIPVIGITGSNGKTIVKEFLYQLLRKDFRIIRSPRSFNSQLGVPLSVWPISQEYNLGIFEAGISQKGEMEKLEQIIRPTIGLMTNIGAPHQENFVDIETKLHEKLKLFRHSDFLIFNSDYESVAKAISSLPFDGKLIRWSRKDSSAYLYVSRIISHECFSVITFSCLGVEYTLSIPFTDDASIEDLIHCIALISILDPDVLLAKDRFVNLDPVEMRMEVKAGDRGNTIINDVYSNDVDSFGLALDFQRRRTRETSLRKIVVLSDILQSGVLPEDLYRHVAETLSVYKPDFFVSVGPDITSVQSFFSGIPSAFFSDVASLLKSGIMETWSECCILLKGARKYRFEQITERLVQQVHETALRINLSAIIHNLNFYRGLLPVGTKIMCMVKAQGYGVGSYELVRTLQEHHVDYIAVAVADEGKELRERGVNMPIVVMNPEINAFQTLIDYRLEPEIYNLSLLFAFSDAVIRNAVSDYPVHIKIDTGMHRLGFMPSEISHLSEILSSGDLDLSVRSVFTHLAVADDPIQDDFTRGQFLSFDKAYNTLVSFLGYKPLRHVLNTAGIERFTDFPTDMVRLGIGLYGVSASGIPGLRPVATLTSSILQIKELAEGNTIGYGRKGILTKPSRIAIIPIGYADGWDRLLSCGKGEVLVRGKRCPVVGNICMDTCMIDVTDVSAEEGDTVILFGEEIPIEEVARKMQTIPYEVLTGISPRVRRVYFQE